MRSVELLGTFVIPELAKRGASHAASVLTDGNVKAEETTRERETTLNTSIDCAARRVPRRLRSCGR